MAQAAKDGNVVATLIATLNSDGVTPTRVKAEAATHELKIDDNTTGSDLSGDIAYRDQNGEPVLMAVSETDGVTPTPVYVDSDGKLLIDST